MDLTELSMGKKRDKKVMITDQAIEKVPLIEYEGLSRSDNAAVQYLTKKVLRVSQKENDSNEVAVVYRPGIAGDTGDYALVLGSEDSVDLLRDAKASSLLRRTRECILVVSHNHPNLSKISLIDADDFLVFSNVRILIAVSKLGAVSCLFRTKKYNHEKANDLLDEAIRMDSNAKSLRERQKAAEYFLKNCSTAGISYTQVRKGRKQE